MLLQLISFFRAVLTVLWICWKVSYAYEVRWLLNFSIPESQLSVNLTSQHNLEYSLRDNAVISLSLNLTLLEYFYGKKMLLAELLPFHKLSTAKLLTTLCPLDPCPVCQGTGKIYCSFTNKELNSKHCHLPQESPSGASSCSSYSVPCPVCLGYGKQDHSRQTVLDFYESGLFQKYPTYTSASLDYLDYLSAEVMTNQTKACLQFLYDLKEKLVSSKPYYLDLPAFLHPLYPLQSLSFDLPVRYPSLIEGLVSEPKQVEVTIQDIEEQVLFQTQDLLLSFQKNHTHFALVLDVFVTAEEMYHGFLKKIDLFPPSDGVYRCQLLTINRTNQLTLPNTTLTIPLSMLFQHLCQSPQEDNLDKLYRLTAKNYASLYPSRQSDRFLIRFQLFAEDTIFAQLKEKWYCQENITYEDQRRARLQNLQYVYHQYVHRQKLQEIYCITILNDAEDTFPTVDLQTRQEIIHPREYRDNFHYERLLDLKLRNWLLFLSKL